MKATLLFTLSFLLFALTTYFPLASTKYVYDTEGYPLAPGYKYYLVQTSTSGQEGGALILGDEFAEIEQVQEDPECPLTVLQEFCDETDGLAVTFNVSGGGGFQLIEDTTNVEIEFVNKPNCAQSSKWLLVTNFFRFHTNWISIGSLEDLGDIQIIGSEFNIQEQGEGYKFVFYAKWARTYFDFKRFNDVNGRRLVANDIENKKYHPFEVQFVNAKLYGRSVV
jgi:hypothetical protein